MTNVSYQDVRAGQAGDEEVGWVLHGAILEDDVGDLQTMLTNLSSSLFRQSKLECLSREH